MGSTSYGLKIASTVFNIIIRMCLKNKEDYIVDNAVDLSKLAIGLGKDGLEAMEMRSSFEIVITRMARKLEEANIMMGINDDAKKLILDTLISDFYEWANKNEEIIIDVLENKDIKTIITNNSKKERELWSEKENGVYENCARYMISIFVEYVKSLESFSANGLIKLYERIEKFEECVTAQIQELTNIILKSLSVKDKYRDFEKEYLTSVSTKYKKINLFGAGLSCAQVRSYDVMSSFVSLNCIKQDVNDSKDGGIIPLRSVFEENTIVWLNGEAGCGKTTYIHWLAVSAAINQNHEAIVGGLIPIVVKLRNVIFPFDYENEINKEVVGIAGKCPEGYAWNLIEEDKILLIFDGLDEISEKRHEEIYSVVNQLSGKLMINSEKRKEKIKSRIIITTRPYVKDGLDCVHAIFSIERMKMPQVREFIGKWHETILGENNSVEDIEAWAGNIMQKIESSGDLRNIVSTPLLCAMVCAINYHENGAIPTNKGELYEQCCRMLIDDRDRERNIKIDELERYSNLNYVAKSMILQQIALYMLQSEKTEMDKGLIVEFMTSHFRHNTMFINGTEKLEAGGVLDYLIERTGLVREISNGNIDFVHKTFMEFLAAEAINDGCLWSLIPKNVTNYFWKETVLMSFWRVQENRATSLLKDFIGIYHEKHDNEIILMASMCANSATGINVSIKNEIEKYIEKIIPPESYQVTDLAQAGEYVLPFLAYNEKYTENEQMRCLDVLNAMIEEMDESYYNIMVTVLLSYILAESTILVKAYAGELLSDLPEEIIDDNDTKNVVCRALLGKKNSKKNIEIPSSLFQFLRNAEKIKKINSLYIIKWNYYDYAMEKYYSHTIPKYIVTLFDEVSELRIDDVDDVSDLKILERVSGLRKLDVIIKGAEVRILEAIGRSNAASNLLKLRVEADDIESICFHDLEKCTNLEELELVMRNSNLSYDLYSILRFDKLKRFSLTISEFVYYDYQDCFDEMSKIKDIEVNIKISDESQWEE